MKRTTASLLICFSFLVLSEAQKNASLSGVVTDPALGEILVGANIYFENTGIGSISDLNGEYTIIGIPSGDYNLTVSYIGYESYNEQIRINAGESVVKNIALKYSGSFDLEEVTITAQAKGQLRAINQQLQSDDIKNVVSSDRIRELPDANAAESLGRLPGVSLKRTGGEGDKVVIRGMSPKYVKVMMDGVDLAGTDANDRSVSLNGISAYSLDGIEVVKSARADMDGDFVGGAVNFKLRSAQDGFHSEIMTQGTYNNLKSDFGNYKLMGNVSNRFFNNRFGVFAMVQAENLNRSANSKFIAAEARSFDESDPDFTHTSLTLQDELRTVNRKNATLVLDYRLKDGSLKFKNFYSNRSDHNEFYSERFPTRDGLSDVYTEVRDLTTDQTLISNNLAYEQQFGSIKVDGIVAHSYTKSDNPEDMIFNFRQAKTGDGSPVTENIPQDIHPDDALDYSNADYHYLGFNTITYTPNSTHQRQYQGEINIEWAFTLANQVSGKLKAGGKYRHQEREYEYDYWTGRFGAAGNELGRDYYNDNQELFEPGDIDIITNEILYPYFIDPNTEPDEFLDGSFGPFLPRVDLDKLHHVTDYMMFDYYAIPENQQKDVVMHNAYLSNTFDYSGTEDYAATYIMGTFNIGKVLTLIPGLRYEQNKTEYKGTTGRSDRSGPNYYRYVEVGDTTTFRENQFLLPNFHLKVKPLKWLQFHIAYTHTLQRPNYSLIIPREDLNDAGNNRYIINNTNLEPELSHNFDFVTSFHENHLGFLSINLFNKNIDGKIFRDYSKPVGDRWEEFGIAEVEQGYLFQWTYNDTLGVNLKGVEIDWQTSFWYLPGFLKGFVFNVNYTYIKSNATYPDGDSEFVDHDENPFTPDIIIYNDHPYDARLIDQPAHLLNISLGYDFKGFSIRTSMRYQDDIFRATSFKPADRAFTGSYLRFDISSSQKLPYGLLIFANLNNINNAQDLDYKLGSVGLYPTRLENYGMTIDLGLRWNFSKVKK